MKARFWLATVSMLAGYPSPAQAQRADVRAAAEVLFNEGRRLMDAGDHAAACPKLEQSQQIDASVGTLGWLGRCYEMLGKTASAWASYRAAISLAQQRGDTQRKKIAEERAAALEGTLSYLTIDASAVAQVSGVTVLRNGAEVPSSLWSAPFPVDPGEHVLEARAPNYEPSILRLQVAGNGSRQVATLKGLMPVAKSEAEPAPAPTPAVMPEPTAPAVTTAPEPAPERIERRSASPMITRDEPVPRRSRSTPPLAIAGYISLAAGAAGLGVGAYFVYQRSSNLAARDQACPAVPPGDCPSEEERIEYEARQKDAKDAASFATPTLIIGGALVATGFTLLLIASSQRSDSAALSLTPVATNEGGGVWMRGRW
jgi:hypothetical protein